MRGVKKTKLFRTFEDNILPDACTKRAKVQVKGNTTISFLFTIEDVPEKTESFAWTFVDYGSIPVCSFAYIHWVITSVSTDVTVISEGSSRLGNRHAHGKNSLAGKLLSEDYLDINGGYMGPYPPDKDHIYALTVYALDRELPSANSFYMNELLYAIEGHMLTKKKLDLVGRYQDKKG